MKLGDVCEIEFGTRVRRKDSPGGEYSVYGGGGATFTWPSYNREDCYIVSRFAMSEECVRFVSGKFFLNDSGLSVKSKDPSLSQVYLDWALFAKQPEIYALGRGAAQKNLDMEGFLSLELSLPPLVVQHEIVTRLEKELAMVEQMAKGFEALKAEADQLFKSTLKETFEKVSRGGAETRRLGDVCETVSSRGHQIKQSEIKESGMYIVVSQSENEIEGYTDFDSPIEEVPLVLFGDHTCIVKKIDKPFVVGADGTKLLKSSMFDSSYLYYALEEISVTLLDGEYRRHYSDLVEREIVLVTLPVQRKIVAKLDAVRERCEKLKRAAEEGLQTAALMRKAILKEAFA